MNNRIFSEEEMLHLSSLSAVKKVTSKQIQYTTEFKEQAVRESSAGKFAKQIFIEAGFDVSIFAPGYCKGLIKQWKRKLRRGGDEALQPKTKGRPKKDVSKELSHEELLLKLAYLEEENRLLKKYQALGYI